jgi:hypothetical protein
MGKRTTPQLDAKGDCYRANGRLFLDLCNANPVLEPTTRLCHGWVTPREGKDAGRCFHHAWVELQDDVVFDHCNGGRVTMRRLEYYRAGRIDETLVVRYRFLEVLERLVLHEGWSLGSV